jgi:hypothetical protein
MWRKPDRDPLDVAQARSRALADDRAMRTRHASDAPHGLLLQQQWCGEASRLPMPMRMHGKWLRRLRLHNDLAEGRYRVDDKAVGRRDSRAMASLRVHGRLVPAPGTHVHPTLAENTP